MKRIRFTELNETVRGWLSDILQEPGVIIEDEAGNARGTVISYRDPKPEQRRQAEASLDRLWQKTGPAVERAGVTEQDVIDAVLDDD